MAIDARYTLSFPRTRKPDNCMRNKITGNLLDTDAARVDNWRGEYSYIML